tara:strand:- start:107 stop:697 length:591 start_codon:yes stop_codon:yes gene_type:complete
MANFKMKGHTVFTQSGTDTPTWGTGAPTGAVLQVVGNTIKSTTISHTGTFSDWETITGFYVDITPKKTNSDFFISLTTSIGGNGNAEGAVKIARGYDSSGGTSFTYTDILGDASGSAIRSLYGSYDISADHLITTSSHIWDNDISYASGGKFRYQVYWRNPHNTSGDLFLNRADQNDRAENLTGVSSIIVQEIAGI